MKRKIYGTRPKTVTTGRNMTGNGNIYHTFKRREMSLISRLDKAISRDYDNWHIDINGNFIYTCGR